MINKLSYIFEQNLKTYIKVIFNFLLVNDIGKKKEINNCLDKLNFTLPKGLNKKDIKLFGKYQVISQSKEYSVGYSDRSDLLIENDLPLVIYGDHSQTVKYVDNKFIIGADGVKILKPKEDILEKYFYYCLLGASVETKNYGRHFSLLKKENIIIPNIDIQQKVINFLDDLSNNKLNNKEYFNKFIETEIVSIHKKGLQKMLLAEEIQKQKNLIKKLKESILQDAITGKLTKDWRKENPDVDPVNELLRKIKVEKEKLIKDKKLKKDKLLSLINEEEIPFELPNGWVWQYFTDISYIVRGGSPRPINNYLTNDSKGFNWIKIGDTKIGGKYIKNTKQKIKKDGLSKTRKVIPGDFLLTNSMSFGRPYISKINGCIHDGWLLIRTSKKIIDEDFLYNLLSSKYVFESFKKSANGGVVQNLNIDKVKCTAIPIPPLSEQKEIVKKTEELLQKVKVIEEEIKKSEENTQMLMQSILKEAFEK